MQQVGANDTYSQQLLSALARAVISLGGLLSSYHFIILLFPYFSLSACLKYVSLSLFLYLHPSLSLFFPSLSLSLSLSLFSLYLIVLLTSSSC